VNVIPFEPVTPEGGFAKLGAVNVTNVGTGTLALDAPMSAPPVPLMVKLPGTRNVPFALSFELPAGSVSVPFGPVMVKLDPASAVPVPAGGAQNIRS
jgi:hypothetical protein